MAKSQVKLKVKNAPKKPKLSEINELSLSVFIIKKENADRLRLRIDELVLWRLDIFIHRRYVEV